MQKCCLQEVEIGKTSLKAAAERFCIDRLLVIEKASETGVAGALRSSMLACIRSKRCI